MKSPEPHRTRIRTAVLERIARGALRYQRGVPQQVVAFEFGEDVTPEQREAVEALGGELRPAPPKD